ncbi:hypothetical protein [Orrella marina]|uniref:Uncharacterized protein n=1 Tax=Orrella marina TaxID=2163011 RepID=A0A2R4XJP8_9BURK|nr:hypothetical protein [Orrella marina]AWB33939.1 hypothetical protein DBV39_09715 [Orrella marina]
MSEFVWHYTTGDHRLKSITGLGFLIPSNVGAPKERPLLWFSANQEYEPTAIKMVARADGSIEQLTFEQQNELAGCVRFGLPAADRRLMSWKRACSFARTPRVVRTAMEQTGIQCGGNPAHWFAVSELIPVNSTKAQIWDEAKWRALEGSDHD